MTSSFDDVLGAGALRARRFDDDGLDGPWAWATGSVCVGDRERVIIDLPSISSDVDALQAAIYWYDARHGTSGDLDLVDLTLSDGNYIVSSSQEADNKQRVYEDDLSPNNSYGLRIFGEDVTADNAGCGSNRMRVFYAWYFEDSDREAAEGLSDIDPM